MLKSVKYVYLLKHHIFMVKEFKLFLPAFLKIQYLIGSYINLWHTESIPEHLSPNCNLVSIVQMFPNPLSSTLKQAHI
jgi:hypothetical protein